MWEIWKFGSLHALITLNEKRLEFAPFRKTMGSKIRGSPVVVSLKAFSVTSTFSLRPLR